MMYRILLLLAAVLALCSCSKEAGRQAVQLRLSLPVPATKVTLGSENAGSFPLVWQEGDVVSLNGTLSNPMTAGLAGGPNGVFSFAGFSGSSPYNLLYPGSTAGTVNLDGTHLPLYARSTSLEHVLSMHHLSCGVRLRLTGDLSLASLTLIAPGDEMIAGVFTPDFSTGALTPSSATSSLTVNYNTPVALSETPVVFTLFFAPGTFTQGLLLEGRNGVGVVRRWRFASGSTLEKGKLYLLPETAFSARDWHDGADVSLEEMTEESIDFVL